MIRQEKVNQITDYVESFKTIKHELVHEEGGFLSVDKYRCYLKNGNVITREKIIKNGRDGSAVIVVPKLENGEYLVVVEPRVFTKSMVGVGFPAGYIEKDEKPVDAALRELSEETGYIPKDINDYKLLDSYYQDEGISSAYNYIFLFNDCEKKTSQHLDESEFIKYITLNKDELVWAENIGLISGGNSKLALRKILK